MSMPNRGVNISVKQPSIGVTVGAERPVVVDIDPVNLILPIFFSR